VLAAKTVFNDSRIVKNTDKTITILAISSIKTLWIIEILLEKNLYEITTAFKYISYKIAKSLLSFAK